MTTATKTRDVVAIHGISEKRNAAGFSQPLRRIVNDTISRHNRENREQVAAPAWAEAVWSDLSDLPDRPVLAPLDLFLDVQRFNNNTNGLQERISERIRPLLGPEKVVIAHSLGSMIMIRELIAAAHEGRERPCAALLTMGSPAGLRVDLSIPAVGLSLDIDWRRHGMTLTDYQETLKSWGLVWIDLWTPGDVVHVGGFTGMPKVPGMPPVPTFGARGLEQFYPCSSLELNGGTHPVGAHLHFWRNPFTAGITSDLVTPPKDDKQ